MPIYPVLTFNYADPDIQQIADNIWHAQMAGWPKVLTYRGPLPKATSRAIRKQTMTYEVGNQGYKIPTAPLTARDEYPFACTQEGSAVNGMTKVWVGHVSKDHNDLQGGMIAAFIMREGITANGPKNKFEVRVVNHKLGPVTR
jgi:hypothetical protein